MCLENRGWAHEAGRKGRARRHPFAVSLLFVLLAAAPAAAQEEQTEDDTDQVRARIGLAVPSELRKLKRRAAKRSDSWSWTAVATGAIGYDSNLHDSPGPEQDTAIIDLGARIEALRYLTRSDRLKIAVEATGFVPTATSTADAYMQRADVFYGHRFGSQLSFLLSGKIEHENDGVTNILGNKLARDFEHMIYRVRPTLRWEPVRGHAFRFAYNVKRKDYFETTALNSLDWWKHGPKISYEIELDDRITADVFYSFAVQNYDEEPAAFSTGLDPLGNPDEEHFFHRTGVGLELQPVSWLELGLGYRFKSKDDRFQDFESYGEHKGQASATLLLPAIVLHLEGSYAKRDYDKRLGASSPLEYDRFTLSASARYALSRNLAAYALYGFADRDTNRVGLSNSYRDYTSHQVVAGVTFAL